jgi:hypothetical protein
MSGFSQNSAEFFLDFHGGNGRNNDQFTAAILKVNLDMRTLEILANYTVCEFVDAIPWSPDFPPLRYGAANRGLTLVQKGFQFLPICPTNHRPPA